jgi:hypothetical protein
MFFALLAFTAGLGGLSLGWWLQRRHHDSQRWPSTDGVVLESWIDDHNLESMAPVLRYEYMVHGRRYVGTRVSYSGYGVSRAQMEALIAPYPAGRSVRVFYDPRHPERAVLNNVAPSDWRYWLAAGIAFLALAAMVASRSSA